MWCASSVLADMISDHRVKCLNYILPEKLNRSGFRNPHVPELRFLVCRFWQEHCTTTIERLLSERKLLGKELFRYLSIYLTKQMPLSSTANLNQFRAYNTFHRPWTCWHIAVMCCWLSWMQYFFPMDDGSGLKLTVEKYLTPARYDISKQ